MLDRFAAIVGKTSAVLGLGVVLLSGGVVASRYLFSKSYDWSDELLLILMLYGCFLGGAELVRSAKHITLDLLIDKFRGAPRNWLEFFNQLTILAFCVWMTYVGIGVAIDQINLGLTTGTSLRLPKSVVFLMVPVGLGLAGFFAVFNVIDFAKGGKSGRKTSTAATEVESTEIR